MAELSTAYYRIGDLVLRIGGGPSVALVRHLSGFGTFATRPCEADISILLDQPMAHPDCRWLHHFRAVSDTVACRFGIDTSAPSPCYYYTLGDRTVLRFDTANPTVVCCTAMPSADVLQFALWLAYATAGLWRGRIPIHASAVVWNGQAVLCLGESGTGKSTHTRLWTEHITGSTLLNDDSPILAITPRGTMAYGSPWSGKTPCFRPTHYPVAALVRIRQHPSNAIQRLGTLAAFAAVHPSCPPALAKDEAMLDRSAALLSSLIRTTPIYELRCRPDAEAAQLCHHTLFDPCS